MNPRSLNFLFIAMLFTVNSRAQMGFTIYPSENQVKAKYLYNFARFVEWPDTVFPDAKTPITIGVIGEDPFGIDLNKTVEGKRIDGREFRIERFDCVENIPYCHILFIGACNRDERCHLLDQLNGVPTLTIGDMDRFASDGGMINFIVVDQNVRFEINHEAARRSGLILSPRILKMAKIVQSDKMELRG
ncbi:YfiR family protein [bacterium]|nr:YfiR family protein [bacterium]RQV97806.1 MAG: YfiR family protein [bacterium]